MHEADSYQIKLSKLLYSKLLSYPWKTRIDVDRASGIKILQYSENFITAQVTLNSPAIKLIFI